MDAHLFALASLVSLVATDKTKPALSQPYAGPTGEITRHQKPTYRSFDDEDWYFVRMLVAMVLLLVVPALIMLGILIANPAWINESF